MQTGIVAGPLTGISVFPYFIVHGLPTGRVTGLLIASIVAAGMRTVATSVSSSATVYTLQTILKDFLVSSLQKAISMRILYGS